MAKWKEFCESAQSGIVTYHAVSAEQRRVCVHTSLFSHVGGSNKIFVGPETVYRNSRNDWAVVVYLKIKSVHIQA